MAKKIFEKKAQGTIEYLVIIAIVVVVALIVVGLLITLMGSGGDISGTSNQINYKTQTLALNDYLVSTDGNYLLEIKSNEVGNITIDNISINGEDTPFTTNNTINLGQERLIKIESSTTCEEGQKVATQNITITYTTTNGLTKKQTYESVSIPCQNYTNPNENQLLGGTTSEASEDEIDPAITQLRSGLVGYWPLDETSGTTAYDNSGNGYNGELIDGAVFASGGLIEGAVDVDPRNTSNYKRVMIDIPKQNSFTYQIWSKRSVTGHQELIYRSSDSTSSPLSMLGFGNNSQFFIKPFGSEHWGPSVSCPGDYCFSNIDIWYHVVITYDSATGELKNYVNTLPIINQSVGASQSESGDILFFGGRNTSWGGLSGLISEAAFWDRALSSDEIESLYNEGNGLSLKIS